MGKTYLQGTVLTAADLNASLSEAVNTTGSYVFTGVHTHNTYIEFAGSNYSPQIRIRDTSAGVISFFDNPDPDALTGITGPIYNYNVVMDNAAFRFKVSQVNSAYDIGSEVARIDAIGNIYANNIISDKIGNVRQVPFNTQSTAYTLVVTDSGKVISTNSSVTVPSNIFSVGDTITLWNNSTTAAISIIQGTGVTMYWAGQAAATSGNRTLGLLGLSSLICTGTNQFAITGAGLT